ncbi:metal ABC transporter ATP-binding protein [Neolewinella agarilytica]|uniref:Iron/zinc/copper transport system ATP-binding protein/manganese/zinc/iron transport system ATP-binding protein n=1 Tax=Neolewinella agarilytica TaxID=478744 RepID=A0A1H9F805_9BACT|nr:metal ABC transporter ATP-binding protein [Neolewinella agarilytica]SEQ33573.1 iron/zinc/copper transport system ATP-binding protein/manganese/zinc/iron transport system ATP-binding protein [Neolewinella agarilytica]
MPHAITVNDLSVSYDRKRVLNNIFLEIEEGHRYGILGPNGSGKSTLLKAMLGLIDDYTGTIQVLGQDVQQVRKRVVYVPQRSEIDFTFPATVRDVVLMGRYPHKRVFQRLNAADNTMAEAAMRELDILNLQDRQIGELSGGQQQRTFLARALAQGADILLLDEPFVGVDIPTEEKIIEVLRKLSAEGKTLMVVHHDLQAVPEYFDHVILLNQRLIAYGPTEEVFTPEVLKRAFGGQLALLQQAGQM